MTEITFEHVSKAYSPGMPVVDDFTLEIADGEFMVFVGPSGSGKTTALRMIAGLERPTGGLIRLGDDDVTDLPPRERDIAMVFQNYALYPNMTVAQNMGFGLKIKKVAKDDIARRVNEAAEMMALTPYLDRKSVV